MRKIVAAAGVLVLCVSAHAANRCRECKLPFTEGTIACWGCGAHLPNAPKPQDVLPLDITPIQILVEEDGVAASAASPEVALEAIESWIRDNPREYDEAASRLEEFLSTVKGTVLEKTVANRLREIKAAKAEAEKPKSPQERLKEAALAYPKVMAQIRKEPGRTARNIRLLEELLYKCKGTVYETLVEKQLERERAKQ